MPRDPGCFDQEGKGGILWLDPLGRSCKYYDNAKDECYANINATAACCACRNETSLLETGSAENDAPLDSVWTIVVVAFCLLLICILSVSFYFICHLYRNEKRKNRRLLRANMQRHSTAANVNIKSEFSKSDLEAEDEYAAIPGDIGVGKKSDYKRTEAAMAMDDDDEDVNIPIENDRDNDNGNDDEDYPIAFGEDDEKYPEYRPSTFKIRASFRSKTASSNASPESTELDEYAAVDNLAVKNKKKSKIFKNRKSKKKITTLPLKASKPLQDNKVKAYRQSTRRRFSAELEDITLKRKRQSSKFQSQTQDDMIFLSFNDYLKSESTRDVEEEKEKETEKGSNKERFSRISTRRVVKLYAPQEIKYDDIDFSGEQFIGKGSFGAVMKAKYHEIDVAVKKLHAQRLSGSELLNFKQEAAIMQKVGGHKHIARMYGFCTKPEICIVTEYYSRGSLHDILMDKKRSRRITTELKLQMSLEASLGIWHLHQQQVIHRDISARNLLVDENWTVVVADLGMSRFKGSSSKPSVNIGPVKWMAPESIIGNEYSEKSDSYSFGITLYEIFSEAEPYPGLLPLEAGAKVVHEGLRPSIDKNKKIVNVPNLSKLLTMLWKPQPKDRPDFLFITQSLKKIKKQWLIKKSKYKSK